ncbi:MAG: hypothetical protein ABIP63_10540 [Thermoanaerobaculia bacterium]
MREMLRKIPAVVFALACILIAEPLLHAHPLSTELDASSSTSGRTCGVCATGANVLPGVSPALCAPLSVPYLFAGSATSDVPLVSTVSLGSRGPPLS